MNFVGWIFLAVLAVLVLWAISVYNGLVVRRNRYRNAYAQIDVQLKRRHDLIPNMSPRPRETSRAARCPAFPSWCWDAPTASPGR